MSPSDATLQGHFAGDRFRLVERRWQRIGLALLIALALGSLAGAYGMPTTALRAAGVYAFLLVVFRVAGRRTLAQITNFDLIVVLIMGDVTQQAIVGDDPSIATAMVAVATLIVLDVALGRAKDAWPRLDAGADGLPLILISHGVPHPDRMASESVGLDDVLAAARERHGLTRIEDIEFAVLERSGGISIVARKPARPGPGLAAESDSGDRHCRNARTRR
jgi:uncharacterized membrane protein YcaP (DUF421 family)